jgi:hypothetical protein
MWSSTLFLGGCSGIINNEDAHRLLPQDCVTISTAPTASEEEECTGSRNLAMAIGCILTYSGSTVDIVINYLVLIINLMYCVAFVISATKQTTQMSVTSSGRRQHIDNTTTTNASYRLLSLSALIFVVVFQIVLCLFVGCTGISIIWCAMCGWILSNERHRRQREDPSSVDTTIEYTHPNDSIIINNNDDSTNMNNGNSTVEVDNTNDNGDSDNRTSTIEFHSSSVSGTGTHFDNTWMGRQRVAVVCLDMLTIVYYAVISPFITTVAHTCALVLGAVLSTLTSSSIKTSPLSPTTSDTSHSQHDESRTNTVRQVDSTDAVTEPLLLSQPSSS